MRAFIAVFLTAAVAVVPLTTQSAGADKTLQNMKGTVQYQSASGTTQAVAANSQIALNDQDTAITGDASEASVGLPDSSVVLIGQNSKVQLQSFNQTDIANASFVVVNGKIRFKVEHPNGAHANYTFQTSTGQIAVRGTVGDVAAFNGQLQVNVYDVSDPANPVTVTLNNGQVITLGKGQSLLAHGLGAGITSSVGSITQNLFDPFTEFGVPSNYPGLALTGAGAGAAAGATGLIVGGAAAAGLLILTTNGNKNVITQPSPFPSTISTGINITVHNQRPENVTPPTPSPQITAPHQPGSRLGPL